MSWCRDKAGHHNTCLKSLGTRLSPKPLFSPSVPSIPMAAPSTSPKTPGVPHQNPKTQGPTPTQPYQGQLLGGLLGCSPQDGMCPGEQHKGLSRLGKVQVHSRRSMHSRVLRMELSVRSVDLIRVRAQSGLPICPIL